MDLLLMASSAFSVNSACVFVPEPLGVLRNTWRLARRGGTCQVEDSSRQRFWCHSSVTAWALRSSEDICHLNKRTKEKNKHESYQSAFFLFGMKVFEEKS